jgi:predicted DNA-binding protein (UPF0251 family)
MVMKAKLPLLNEKTGEIVEVIAYVYGRPKAKDRGFIKVFHVFAEEVLSDPDIMKGAFRLFLYIMTEKLEANRLVFYMTKEEVMEKLGISKATYYLWLKALLNKGHIRRLGPNYYAVSPRTAIIGRLADIEPLEDILGRY